MTTEYKWPANWKPRGALNLTRSYNFTDKREVIQELRNLTGDSPADIKAISARSGVSKQAIYNWYHGKTLRPQLPTINAVARVYGLRIGLVRSD